MDFMKKIISTGVALLLIVLGIKGILEGIGVIESKEMKLCQELLDKGGNAIATYDLEKSKEKITKIAGAEISSYELVYTFVVDGNTYSGEQSTRNLPESLKTRVMYIKENPGKNYIRPGERLEELKEFADSNDGIWMGLGAFFIGVLILGWRIKELLNLKKVISERIKTKKENAIFSVADELRSNGPKLSKADVVGKPTLSSRFKKKDTSSENESRENRRNERRSQKSVGEDVSATISKKELLEKSKKTFGETDHSRFMPSSKRFKSEEE